MNPLDNDPDFAKTAVREAFGDDFLYFCDLLGKMAAVEGSQGVKNNLKWKRIERTLKEMQADQEARKDFIKTLEGWSDGLGKDFPEYTYGRSFHRALEAYLLARLTRELASRLGDKTLEAVQEFIPEEPLNKVELQHAIRYLFTFMAS